MSGFIRGIGKLLFSGVKAARKTKALGKQVGKTNIYGQKVFKRQITKQQPNGYERYQLTTLNWNGSVASTVTVDRSFTHRHVVKETPIKGTNARNRTESMTWKRGTDYSRPQGYDNYTNGFTSTTRSTYNPKTHTVTRETTNFGWLRERETGGVNNFQEGTLRINF